MKRELEALRAGSMTFDAFVRETQGEWFKLARSLRNQWRLSGSGDMAEIEDVQQIMLMEAYSRLRSFDETKTSQDGTPVGLLKYVLFNACDKAKKWLRRQVAVKRGAMVTVPLSALGKDSSYGPEADVYSSVRVVGRSRVEARASGLCNVVDDVEDEIADCEEHRVCYAMLMSELEPRHKFALAALKLNDGDTRAAARAMFEDDVVRDALFILDEDHATRMIQSAVRASRKILGVVRRVA